MDGLTKAQEKEIKKRKKIKGSFTIFGFHS